MAGRKTPSLHRHTARAQGSARRQVAIEGRCRIGGRAPHDVLVTDLGESGCRLHANAIGVTKAEPLELWLGEMGPIAGRLKWTRNGALGVSFDTALAPETLAALYEVSQHATVIPMRR